MLVEVSVLVDVSDPEELEPEELEPDELVPDSLVDDDDEPPPYDELPPVDDEEPVSTDEDPPVDDEDPVSEDEDPPVDDDPVSVDPPVEVDEPLSVEELLPLLPPVSDEDPPGDEVLPPVSDDDPPPVVVEVSLQSSDDDDPFLVPRFERLHDFFLPVSFLSLRPPRLMTSLRCCLRTRSVSSFCSRSDRVPPRSTQRKQRSCHCFVVSSRRRVK